MKVCAGHFLSIYFLLAFFLISKAKMGRVGFGFAYSISSLHGLIGLEARGPDGSFLSHSHTHTHTLSLSLSLSGTIYDIISYHIIQRAHLTPKTTNMQVLCCSTISQPASPPPPPQQRAPAPPRPRTKTAPRTPNTATSTPPSSSWANSRRRPRKAASVAGDASSL